MLLSFLWVLFLHLLQSVCTVPWIVSLPTGIAFLNANEIVVKIKAGHLLIILHPFLPVGEKYSSLIIWEQFM